MARKKKYDYYDDSFKATAVVPSRIVALLFFAKLTQAFCIKETSGNGFLHFRDAAFHVDFLEVFRHAEAVVGR